MEIKYSTALTFFFFRNIVYIYLRKYYRKLYYFLSGQSRINLSIQFMGGTEPQGVVFVFFFLLSNFFNIHFDDD